MATMVSEQRQRQVRCQKMAAIMRMLSQLCLAEWPSFLEDLSNEDDYVVEE